MRYEMSIGRNDGAQQRHKQARRPRPIVDALPSLNRPTLLLWGKNDRGVAVERGVLLFQALPDAEFHVFNRCGHWAQWDQTPRFHEITVGFLNASTE